jgi:hypothetical protein
VPHYRRIDTSLLLTGEDPEGIPPAPSDGLQPFPTRDEVEQNVVQDLANLQWRLNRIPDREAAMFEKGDWAGVSTLALYEQRLVDRFEQTRRMLIKLQMEALPGEKACPNWGAGPAASEPWRPSAPEADGREASACRRVLLGIVEVADNPGMIARKSRPFSSGPTFRLRR